MLSRHVARYAAAFIVGLSSALLSHAAEKPVPPPSAAARMNAPGPEAEALARRTGTWNVVMTFRPTADAKPTVVKGMVAERRMVGLFLQEIMKPAPGSKLPAFRRIAYLTYSKIEGRWQYVSLDTRFPVGIMPAYSFDKGNPKMLTLQFEPLAFVGMGNTIEGKMMRSNLVITQVSDDHEVVRQYWVTSDGTGRKWLAVQYDYTRAGPAKSDQ